MTKNYGKNNRSARLSVSIKTKTVLASILSATFLFAANAAYGQEIRFKCSYDGNGCEVFQDILNRYEQEHSDVKIVTDIVPYRAILEGLPVELASGNGPDLATITDYGGLSRYYLDLTPYVDASLWEENFGHIQPWYRKTPEDKGIYGLQTQLTVSGAYINRTLFDQAGVQVPVEGASFEDWAEAAEKVAKATKTPYPMALDRSGHRIAGPAISYGAKFFNEEGRPVLVDEGFKTFVSQFVQWHKEGIMARDVWGGLGGDRYRDAAQEFINGQLVYYYSGSWQVGRFSSQIGDSFDWEVAPAPCGSAACSGMVGGTGIVGFKQTQYPEIVASIIDYLARQDIYSEFVARTLNVPAHRGVIAEGVTYDNVIPSVQLALSSWVEQVATLDPVAYIYQGYRNSRAMFNISVQRITQAIAGELSIDEALARAEVDLEDALKQVE